MRRMTLLSFFLLASHGVRASPPDLNIVQPFVQQYEDAAAASSNYQFLPGDPLFFTFQVAGFAAAGGKNEEPRRISLHYEVVLEDASKRALAEPAAGDIQVDLNPEDKNWLPKRSVSFTLPPFLAAGEYQVKTLVEDQIAKQTTTKQTSFRVGGTKVTPTETVAVENFQFLRKPDDRKAIEVAAYAPGDTVYARFNITGFGYGAENAIRVAYTVKVFRPDGKVFFDDAKPAELQSSSFYPAQFVPGRLSVNLSADTSPGAYRVVLSVRDLQGGKSADFTQIFQVER